MPVLIFGQDELLADWAAHQIPHVGDAGFGPCSVIGVAAGNDPAAEFYAACVYHDYNPQGRTISISMAARSAKWATRGVIRALLHYPFEQLRVFKVWLSIPADNARALRFNLGIGMIQESVLRHHFARGRHAVIVSMTEPEYLKSRWCSRQTPHKAAA